MCRGVQKKKPVIKPKDLPALTLKEALEMYYSFKRSDKTVEREERWRYLRDRLIFRTTATCANFMMQCMRLLKHVDFFESKIRYTKQLKKTELMSQWSDKLAVYLKVPFHDTLKTFGINRFKAVEYPGADGQVKVLCFNCPDRDCVGCIKTKVVEKPEVPAIPKTKRGLYREAFRQNMKEEADSGEEGVIRHRPRGRPPLSSRGRGRGRGGFYKFPAPTAAVSAGLSKVSQVQMEYYKRVGVWKTKRQLKEERTMVGQRLGLDRRATMSEVFSFLNVKRRPGRPRKDDAAWPGEAKSTSPSSASAAFDAAAGPSGSSADKNGASASPGRPRQQRQPPSDAQMKAASAGQIKHYEVLKEWVSRKQLRYERMKLGKKLGYDKPCSLKELIAFKVKLRRRQQLQREGGGKPPSGGQTTRGEGTSNKPPSGASSDVKGNHTSGEDSSAVQIKDEETGDQEPFITEADIHPPPAAQQEPEEDDDCCILPD